MSRRSGKHSRRSRREDLIRTVVPPGSSPGLVMADPDAVAPQTRLLAYGPGTLIEKEVHSLDAIRPCLEIHPVTWVDVDGLGDAGLITGIGEIFGLHALSLEDVAHAHQRPKVERYPEYLFIVARMPLPGPRLSTEQLSLFLGRNFVVTFQEGVPGDCFDPVRQRLRDAHLRIRQLGADYLAYSLMDALVDSYFPVLEGYGERLETLEDEVLTRPNRETISHLQHIKRDLLTLRRVFWPLREAVGLMQRDDSGLISAETRLFMRDCYDHTVQMLDLLETYREIAHGLVDLYLSTVSNRMNEIIKVLTVISTIFIPLSFIAGVYGMNFDPEVSPMNMPELRWYYGYPYALTLMAVVAGTLLLWMVMRGWLSREGPFATTVVTRDRASEP